MKSVSSIILKQMELGPMENFLYFLGCAETKEIAVIDPAWDVKYLLAEAKKNGWTITQVLLTHGHPDHVNGLPDILKTHDVPIYVSKHESPFYKPHHKNIREVSPNDVLTIGKI